MSTIVAASPELDFDELAEELSRAEPSGLSPSASRLLLVKALYWCSVSIASVFLNLYLFQLGGFRTVATYCLAELVTLTLGFVITGSLMRRFNSVRLLQIGTMGSALVYALLLLLGPSAIHFVVALGALSGLAAGFYWTTVNLSEYVVTSAATRSTFYGRGAFWNGLVSVIGPLLGGVVVVLFHDGAHPVAGYYVLFAVLIAALTLVSVTARKLVRCSDVRFSARKIGGGLRSPHWRRVFLLQFFGGIWGASMTAFTPILLFLAVQGEFTVGLLSATSAIVGAVAARTAGRLLHRRPSLFAIGSIFVPCGLLGFVFAPGWFGIFWLSFVLQVANPFSMIPALRAPSDCLESEQVHWRDSLHHIAETEVALNSGRIIGFLAVLSIVGAGSETSHLSQALVVAAALPLLSGLVQARIQRNYAN